MLNLQATILFLIAVPNFVLGLIIIARKSKNASNLFFALFALCVGLWSFGLGGYIQTNSLELAQSWAQGYYVAAALIALTFLSFALSLNAYWTKKSKILKSLLYVPSLVISFIFILDPGFLIDGIVSRPWGKEVILNGVGYGVFSLYFSVYALAGFVVVFRELLGATGSRKQYLKLVFSGLTIAFSTGALFNLILPALGNYRYIWVGPLFTVTYVMLISYGIIKHKMFEVGSLAARSAAYILSTVLLATVYGVFTFTLIGSVFFDDEDISISARIVYTLLAVVTAIAYQPLKGWFNKLSNKMFYRDVYDAQTLIDDLNQVLVGEVDIKELLEKTAEIIEKNIKATYCGFYIRETAYFPSRYIANHKKDISEDHLDKIRQLTLKIPRKIHLADSETSNNEDKILNELLKKNDIEVLGRLVSMLKYEVAGVGYMLLGPKQSGEVYSRQDAKVLEIITNELVLAVENALHLEEIEQFNVTLQKKIDSATKELQDSNDKLKALDEAKDEFVSMASHQLRTPLTSIKGYISMVLEGDAGKVTDTQKKMLGQAFFSS